MTMHVVSFNYCSMQSIEQEQRNMPEPVAISTTHVPMPSSLPYHNVHNVGSITRNTTVS